MSSPVSHHWFGRDGADGNPGGDGGISSPDGVDGGAGGAATPAHLTSPTQANLDADRGHWTGMIAAGWGGNGGDGGLGYDHNSDGQLLGGTGGDGGQGGAGASQTAGVNGLTGKMMYLEVYGGDGGDGGLGGDGGDVMVADPATTGIATGSGGAGGNGGAGGGATLNVGGNTFTNLTLGGAGGFFASGGYGGYGGLGGLAGTSNANSFASGGDGTDGAGGAGGNAILLFNFNTVGFNSGVIGLGALGGNGGLGATYGTGGDAALIIANNTFTGTAKANYAQFVFAVGPGFADTSDGSLVNPGAGSWLIDGNTFDGGLGHDTFDLSLLFATGHTTLDLSQLAVSINLATQTFDVGTGVNTITSFEDVIVSTQFSTEDGAGNVVYLDLPVSITGDAHNNYLSASYGDDTVDGGAGNDILLGYFGDDSLTGGLGNDVLDGEDGADTMTGGKGDDTFYVDDAADVVVEAWNQGHDVVHASVSYSLVGTYVEDLYLDGTADIDATGNDSGNILTGNSGDNTLDGGRGPDVLSGGSGADDFLFGLRSGHDTITDFSAADNDSIDVSAYSHGTAHAGWVTQASGDVLISIKIGVTITVQSATVADVLAHMVW